METKKISKSSRNAPLYTLVLWREGLPDAARWREFEHIVENRHRLLSAKDSPMGITTSSIYAVSDKKWNKVNGAECYTSTMDEPLYLLRFFDFPCGDYFILTNICWSLEVHSLNQHDRKERGTFSVCSLRDDCGPCNLKDDLSPSDTATISTTAPAKFLPRSKPTPDRERREFMHRNDPSHKGALQKIILRIGTGFSKTFELTNADGQDGCTVAFGFPKTQKSKGGDHDPHSDLEHSN